jgi:hypothetical protein
MGWIIIASTNSFVYFNLYLNVNVSANIWNQCLHFHSKSFNSYHNVKLYLLCLIDFFLARPYVVPVVFSVGHDTVCVIDNWTWDTSKECELGC